MARVVFVTTSYPRHPGDPEARLRVASGDDVVVLAPGGGAPFSAGPRVVALPGGDAFGWPGALPRLRERPHRALFAGAFVAAASWRLTRLEGIDEIVAHWIIPSAWPVAACAAPRLEVVAHGSDVRLLERLPTRRA